VEDGLVDDFEEDAFRIPGAKVAGERFPGSGESRGSRPVLEQKPLMGIRGDDYREIAREQPVDRRIQIPKDDRVEAANPARPPKLLRIHHEPHQAKAKAADFFQIGVGEIVRGRGFSVPLVEPSRDVHRPAREAGAPRVFHSQGP